MDYDESKTEQPTDWGVSRTKQSATNETDINFIINRYKKTGELQHVSSALMEYRDISGLPDLHAAMNMIAEAQSQFEELPGRTRALVNHDVGKFIPFVDDPANLEVCIEHGLLPESARPAEEKIVPTPPESPIQGGESPPDP